MNCTYKNWEEKCMIIANIFSDKNSFFFSDLRKEIERRKKLPLHANWYGGLAKCLCRNGFSKSFVSHKTSPIRSRNGAADFKYIKKI